MKKSWNYKMRDGSHCPVAAHAAYENQKSKVRLYYSAL